MTGAAQATVRFGTRRLALLMGDERFASTFEIALRSVLDPPDELDVDLVVRITRASAPLAPCPELEIDRGDRSTTWTSPAGRVVVRGREADLEMWPDAVPESEMHFWFAVLVQKLLLSCGVVRLHAAGVNVGDRTVVLVGDKGAGKSTAALGLGQRGAVVLGDDQLALEVDGAAVMVAGSYPSFRLTGEAEAQLLREPLSVEPVMLAGVAKKEVPLGSLVPAAPYEPFPPTDLWFPQVGREFAVTPMRPPEALARLVRAVAEQHRFADTRERAELIDVLGALVSRCRPAAVTLSRDLRDLSRVWDARVRCGCGSG